MRTFPRPRIVVSACLEFENVRYDGKIVKCPVVKAMIPFVDFIKVCPEYEIGLGVPRYPLRIVKIDGQERLVQPRTGRDVTNLMNAYTDRFIVSLPPVDGFLFKSGSPTIGFYNIKVYDHPVGSGVAGRTSGLFARKILRCYPGFPVEDDLRMRNIKIRDDFLTKVYIFADFREAVETGDSNALREFHERNRYLFMCYHPDVEAVLGGALARMDCEKYFNGMRQLTSLPRTASGYAGVAVRILERYADRLSPREVEWFKTLISKYRKNKVSRDGLLETLEALAVMMSDRWVAGQTLFAPYPQELVPDASLERDRDYRKVVSLP
jgi:uncharacterized protein YbbK (DUF523 family)/uncharacterized protein YbgA (DUF1722 family)